MLGSTLLPQPTAVMIAVAAVKIGSRHRQDMGDIDALAASIAEVGLLHPIVVTPNHELIAGARRGSGRHPLQSEESRTRRDTQAKRLVELTGGMIGCLFASFAQ